MMEMKFEIVGFFFFFRFRVPHCNLCKMLALTYSRLLTSLLILGIQGAGENIKVFLWLPGISNDTNCLYGFKLDASN